MSKFKKGDLVRVARHIVNPGDTWLLPPVGSVGIVYDVDYTPYGDPDHATIDVEWFVQTTEDWAELMKDGELEHVEIQTGE